MSFAVDVNILIYASDEDVPLHPQAAAFLHECADGSEVFCLAWLTVMSYLRMAAHSRIFTRPLSPLAAEGNIAALLASPHCRVLAEQEGFFDVYRSITREVPARGNLVPDAHLAAILRQNGVKRLYTHDRDFRKFDFLDVIDPFDARRRQ